MKKILFIVGSFRENSFNKQLSKKALDLLKDRADVTYYDYANLPLINEDTEFPTHPEVKKLWDAVNGSDGVWIFSPEYNASYPGHLKNLLDWLSRPYEPNDYSFGTAAKDTKFAISSAGGGRAGQACIDNLSELINTIGGKLLPDSNLGVQLNQSAFMTDTISSDSYYEKDLEKQVNSFLDFIG